MWTLKGLGLRRRGGNCEGQRHSHVSVWFLKKTNTYIQTHTKKDTGRGTTSDFCTILDFFLVTLAGVGDLLRPRGPAVSPDRRPCLTVSLATFTRKTQKQFVSGYEQHHNYRPQASRIKNDVKHAAVPKWTTVDKTKHPTFGVHACHRVLVQLRLFSLLPIAAEMQDRPFLGASRSADERFVGVVLQTARQKWTNGGLTGGWWDRKEGHAAEEMGALALHMASQKWRKRGLAGGWWRRRGR